MKKILNDKLLGKKLQTQRRIKGIKQLTVAKTLKVSHSYISKIENGKMPIYALLLFEYCKLIDLPLSDLI